MDPTRRAPYASKKVPPVQAIGSILALLGTALIVLAALQFGTAVLGKVMLLAPMLGVAGPILLAVGAWIVLRASQGDWHASRCLVAQSIGRPGESPCDT
jgi:hypothetical protein